jgi:hypothetical protein
MVRRYADEFREPICLEICRVDRSSTFVHRVRSMGLFEMYACLNGQKYSERGEQSAKPDIVRIRSNATIQATFCPIEQ